MIHEPKRSWVLRPRLRMTGCCYVWLPLKWPCKRVHCDQWPCTRLPYTILCYAVQFAARLRTELCSAVQCSAVQCSTVQCSALQRSAVQCSAVKYSTVRCSAVNCTKTALGLWEARLIWTAVPGGQQGSNTHYCTVLNRTSFHCTELHFTALFICT